MSESQIKAIYKVTEVGIYGFFKEHRFLSNFHLCEIEYEGRPYTSTEAAYQAAKTVFPDLRVPFESYKPFHAKSMGRLLPLRPEWEQMKDKLMYELCKQKFTKHEYLKSLLLATGDRYLEETNYWGDTQWGVCNQIGDNKLGNILMRIREEIKTM